MLNLHDLALFVTAVEQRGFAAGGRHLGLPPPPPSKRLALLDPQPHVPLPHRPSPRLALTQVGQAPLPRARSPLSDVTPVPATLPAGPPSPRAHRR
ncbi:hypothetical protein BU225_20365, partial [Stenotrophomonas sp. MB339]|uniref:LysR family transcriptional regulator n=1 Tax=Stenotrophomonas sp. MB339 TaxID=1663558 RepID=UPI0009D60BA6